MEQSVLDEISTIIEKAGYTKPESRQQNNPNQQFVFKKPTVSKKITEQISDKNDYVFKRSDGLWVVRGIMKQEFGRFVSEEWAIRWAEVLINKTN